MDIKVFPGTAKGVVRIPPSKSLAHRAIIAASLADGQSMLTNIELSEDIKATAECMRLLGASLNFCGSRLIVDGIGGLQGLKKVDQALTIDCGESGSTLRFLLPVFALSEACCRFVGRGRLLARPQSVYQEIFTAQGLKFQQEETAIEVCGTLTPGTYQLRGDVSSQFISGLLFSLPLLAADSKIKIVPPLESRSYINLTVSALRGFGIKIEWLDQYTLNIPGNQQYVAAAYEVEGDFSQLAFWAVLGACGGDLNLSGVYPDSLQGDKAIIQILQNCGSNISETCAGYHVSKTQNQGSKIDLADCPDLGPILTVLGACSTGKTEIFNAGRLRIKESDRISAMESELKKLGIDIQSTDDSITIVGGASHGGIVEGHNDHRVVMSLAVLAALGTEPVIIQGAEAINKSYPGFFTDLQSVGIKIEILN